MPLHCQPPLHCPHCQIGKATRTHQHKQSLNRRCPSTSQLATAEPHYKGNMLSAYYVNPTNPTTQATSASVAMAWRHHMRRHSHQSLPRCAALQPHPLCLLPPKKQKSKAAWPVLLVTKLPHRNLNQPLPMPLPRCPCLPDSRRDLLPTAARSSAPSKCMSAHESSFFLNKLACTR